MKLLRKFLNTLNFLKMTTNRFVSKLILAALTITCAQFIVTNKLDAKIPEYKGLYTLFTTDTIGIGQSLLYSNWIENVYTYAPENNAAKKVVSILWHKKLQDEDGEFSDLDNFEVSTYFPTKGITPADLGKIIKYIHFFTNEKDKNPIERDEFIASLSKSARGKGQSDKQKLSDLLEALENLSLNDKIYIKTTTAESLLWAFFESKFDGQDDFYACLAEINPSLINKLNLGIYDKEKDYNQIDVWFTGEIGSKLNALKGRFDFANTDKIGSEKNKIIDAITNKDESINQYDVITYYLIKSAQIKHIPNKVGMANIRYKDPVTSKETKKFPTCFESAILDLISIFNYDYEEMKYKTKLLPEEIENSHSFKSLIEKLFIENGQFISSEIINKKIKPWINLITNIPEFDYSKKENEIRFDLRPSIENLIKVLNKFLDLGFVIEDTKDLLTVSCKNGEKVNNLLVNNLLVNNLHIKIQKDKTELWQKLFDIISAKLSTKARKINFNLTELKKDSEAGNCTGTINVTVGKANLNIIIEKGHAYIDCPERDSSKFGQNEAFEDLVDISFIKLCKYISKRNNLKLIPISTLLPHISLRDYSTTVANFINELSYYSLNLKNPEMKFNFLNETLNQERYFIQNTECTHELISSLIDKIPENEPLFLKPLITYLYNIYNKVPNTYWKEKIIAKINYIINKAKEKNDSDVLIEISARILSYSINNKAFNKEIKSFLSKIIEIPNIKTSDGDTLIHLASSCGNLEFLDMVLNNTNIDINAKGSNGYTPLHNATTFCLATSIKNKQTNTKPLEVLLKNKNINIDVKNDEGDTALEMILKEKKEIISELKSTFEKQKLPVGKSKLVVNMEINEVYKLIESKFETIETILQDKKSSNKVYKDPIIKKTDGRLYYIYI